MKKVVLACLATFVICCGSEEVPEPEPVSFYSMLPEEVDLIHIWPGGECCWVVIESVTNPGTGCVRLTQPSSEEFSYCGESMEGDVRIDGCRPCTDTMTLP